MLERKEFKGKKSVTREFTVETEGEIIRVCNQFYLTTHCVSHSRINTALKNKDQYGNPAPRPTHSPVNNTNKLARAKAKEHINSLPRAESHYCRQQSKRVPRIDPHLGRYVQTLQELDH